LSTTLGGLTEVADRLGLSKQRVNSLRQRPDFPRPVADLASGPVWDMDQVDRWAEESQSRRKGGRPSTSTAERMLGGRYEIEGDPIGSGGFADVYRAIDHRAQAEGGDAVVAVKVLRAPEDEASRARFGRELRLLTELSHPNVIPVLDSGEDSAGRPWYVMPLAKGNLLEELAAMKNSDPEIAEVLRQTCAGLSYIHERGIWHRDLTPGNVLRTRAGLWAISDFGLAREAERRTPTITSTVAGMGTFLYQSPEQMTDAKNASAKADIYSLGRILTGMVVGGHPLMGITIPPNDFASVIDRATKFEADERYANVDDFLADVERVINSPRGRWEPTAEAVSRIAGILRDGAAGPEIADDVVRLMAHPETTTTESHELVMAFVLIPKRDLTRIWESDPDRLRSAYRRFARSVQNGGWPWNFCDELANFIRNFIDLTEDDEALRAGIEALAEMGASHNRFHVRSVVVGILQEIRKTSTAMVALHGLRQAARSAVEWTLESEFAVRSMHPTLREGIEELLRSEPSLPVEEEPPF
jgi:eukaryotic-like serine/threonine-protein kinase